jgi:hypothetical protein
METKAGGSHWLFATTWTEIVAELIDLIRSGLRRRSERPHRRPRRRAKLPTGPIGAPFSDRYRFSIGVDESLDDGFDAVEG